MSNMQELTLFDVGGSEEMEVEKKEKKEKREKKPASKKSASKTTAPAKAIPEPKPDLRVFGDWTIHFATEQFKVSDFFEEIPELGVTLEELRVELEKSFAQFSAARTKWDVDEENSRLFPDAFAGSKGGHSQLRGPFLTSLKEAKSLRGSVAYVPGRDGNLYEVKKSPFGQMVAKASLIPHFENIKPGFTFSLPKIPKEILVQIMSFFKVYTEKGKYEVMIRVYWDNEEGTYVVECPTQTVTEFHIECQYDKRFMGRNQLRYVVVLEIHSHNVMQAFFSETDDRDEQRFGLYAVVGRLDSNTPEILVRAKANNHKVHVSASDVFDLDFRGLQSGYPAEWDEKVTLRGLQL